MTEQYKNRKPKISITDNIKIQSHPSCCCVTLIDKATGLTADLTEVTLETIIRNNNMIDEPTDFGTNESIIKFLVKQYNKYVSQRKKLWKGFDKMVKEFDEITEGQQEEI